MKADLIPDDLIAEARQDPWVGRRLKVHPEFPISAFTNNGETIGFQLPAKASKTGKTTTGTIYIAKKHRGKGYATEALSNFLREHPEAISYVNEKNEASRRAHAKAGWTDTGRRVRSNRKATVWEKKAGISYDEILRGLSGESPQRAIPPEEIAELARAYRDAEAEHTKMHIPTGIGIGGLLGGGLGAALGGAENRAGGGLSGLGIGGILGGIAGHLHRKRLMQTRENLGRELGLIAQQGLLPESAYGGLTMKKTASQIADEVLEKTAFGAIGRGMLGIKGRGGQMLGQKLLGSGGAGLQGAMQKMRMGAGLQQPQMQTFKGFMGGGPTPRQIPMQMGQGTLR